MASPGSLQDIGLVRAGHGPITTSVNHVRGRTVTVLQRPNDAIRYIHLLCERGEFRVRIGTHVTMPSSFNVGSTISDGTGTWPLDANEIRGNRSLIIPASESITVRGYGGGDTLTYCWI